MTVQGQWRGPGRLDAAATVLAFRALNPRFVKRSVIRHGTISCYVKRQCRERACVMEWRAYQRRYRAQRAVA